MSELFGKAGAITIDTFQIPLEHDRGLRCEFSVKRDLKGKPNTIDLKVYNLNPDHRAILEQAKTSTIQIDAGYKGATSTLFIGDVRNSGSITEGANIVTMLSAGDGEKALRGARVSASFKRGTPTTVVLQTLVAAIGVSPGNAAQAIPKLAAFGDMFSMGTVLSGSARRELTRVLRSVGYTWSVQNGALQVLPLKQVLAGSALLVSAATGLEGSPTIDKDGVMSCKTRMIADVIPGRLLVLDAKHLKGQFRIEEVVSAGDTHGAAWGHTIKGKRY